MDNQGRNNYDRQEMTVDWSEEIKARILDTARKIMEMDPRMKLSQLTAFRLLTGKENDQMLRHARERGRTSGSWPELLRARHVSPEYILFGRGEKYLADLETIRSELRRAHPEFFQDAQYSSAKTAREDAAPYRASGRSDAWLAELRQATRTAMAHNPDDAAGLLTEAWRARRAYDERLTAQLALKVGNQANHERKEILDGLRQISAGQDDIRHEIGRILNEQHAAREERAELNRRISSTESRLEAKIANLEEKISKHVAMPHPKNDRPSAAGA